MRQQDTIQAFDPARRTHERVDARLLVRYGISSIDREDYAENISAGGLYIRTNRVFKVGTLVKLVVEFPGHPFHHQAEVAWAIQVPDKLRESLMYGMGIEFVSPDPAWPDFFREWRAGLPDAAE